MPLASSQQARATSPVGSEIPCEVSAIVVDEEHETSYKQGESPRYHAREVAIVRARAQGAVVVLGSATPSLESWVNAQAGKYRLLSLPERVGGGRLPSVRGVDGNRVLVTVDGAQKEPGIIRPVQPGRRQQRLSFSAKTAIGVRPE